MGVDLADRLAQAARIYFDADASSSQPLGQNARRLRAWSYRRPVAELLDQVTVADRVEQTRLG